MNNYWLFKLTVFAFAVLLTVSAVPMGSVAALPAQDPVRATRPCQNQARITR